MKWVISFCLGESFAWGNEQKRKTFFDSQFFVFSSNLNTTNLKFSRAPSVIIGMPNGSKKSLDRFGNDTGSNFQESIPGKVRFQKKWGSMPLSSLPSLRGLFSATMIGGIYIYIYIYIYTSLRKVSRFYSREINFFGVHGNMRGCILEVSFEGLMW